MNGCLWSAEYVHLLALHEWLYLCLYLNCVAFLCIEHHMHSCTVHVIKCHVCAHVGLLTRQCAPFSSPQPQSSNYSTQIHFLVECRSIYTQQNCFLLPSPTPSTLILSAPSIQVHSLAPTHHGQALLPDACSPNQNQREVNPSAGPTALFTTQFNVGKG
jgi:hypothetical protein